MFATLSLKLPLARLRILPSKNRFLSHSPVGAVTSAHAFDEKSLLDYLAQNGVIDSADSIEFKKFAYGQSNPTFVLSDKLTGKNVLVVRKQPPGKLLRGAHDVSREYQVMTGLHGKVPVPETLLHCQDTSIIGTNFFVYRYVDANFFFAAPLPQATSKSMRTQIYTSMLKTLAGIHSVNLGECGLLDYGVRKTDNTPPYVHRQVKTWTKQYMATATEPIADMDYLMENLAKHFPHNGERVSCLVHGDFRMDNMLFHSAERDFEVAAVLDWELSTLGDHMCDLAYHLIPYFLESNNKFFKGIKGLDLEALGIPSISEAIAIYSSELSKKSSGSGGEALSTVNTEDIDYYLAFSFFRIAAICQGVYFRSLQGNASSTTANEALAYAKESARLGRELMDKFLAKEKAKSTSSESWSPSQSVFLPSSLKAGLQKDSPRYFKKIEDAIPSIYLDKFTPKAVDVYNKVAKFIHERIAPAEAEIMTHIYESRNKWTQIHPLVESLKDEAKALQLFNLFLPQDTDRSGLYGAGLTNLEYAPMAELMGRYPMIAPEVFNCGAPDTGNMEVLARYGSPQQKEEWLIPLLEGKIRSCFAMTEPAVASSDATNMAATIEYADASKQEIILNGRKWYISGAADPRCSVCIFMGKNISLDPNVETSKHERHSMVVLPMNTPGIKIIRPMFVMGFDDAPHGHVEMVFDNVRVPSSCYVLGEGRGFEIAQGRLGPGRIHHCMRLIGMAERSLELMVQRSTERIAFGKHLAQQGMIQNDIAISRVEIDQARLLCFDAAHTMDIMGNKFAKNKIGAIKIVAPRMAKTVVDRAMQCHGAMGVSQDTPLAHFWAGARTLQLADGPDEVHIAALAMNEIRSCVPSFKRSGGGATKSK